MTKTKRDRFIEIAGNRTNRIIKDLSLLGNCSNRNNYEYTETDVKKMFNAIENELKRARARFVTPSKKKKFNF